MFRSNPRGPGLGAFFPLLNQGTASLRRSFVFTFGGFDLHISRNMVLARESL